MRKLFTPPFYPIVYVRGYAGSQAEVEDTVATPYMGFNLGSTKIRQRWTGDIARTIFESPLVRLMKDHGYRDIYLDGAELSVDKPAPPKSVWIYRYYEPVSRDLGTGKRPEIEDYARGLQEFIARIREQTCGRNAAARKAFRVHLVAHSMGGLIVRCYLQRIAKTAPPVDKVFTYATPHGGIDFRLIGNVPAFLKVNNVENFNESRMREYLNLPQGPVTSLGGRFDPARFFCLVGTDHRDYEAFHGLSKAAVGPMSDGLVQIQNASVEDAPRAFVHRAHSGHYGIVNSEEGYQNLRRFLFGQVRVDGFLDVHEVTLPDKLEAKRRAGKTVNASYHVEVVARVRGALWDLHRRTTGEESAVFVPEDRMAGGKPVQLLSTFLLDAARVAKRRKSLGFSLDLGVLVPGYEVDALLFLDDHYEGGYLYRDKINIEMTPGRGQAPKLLVGLDRHAPNQSRHAAEGVRLGGGRFEFRIPIEQTARPGLRATLVLKTTPWA